MAEINLSNYTTTLFQASSNAFTDGNVFFDTVAGTVEFGDSTDHATLDLSDYGGGPTDANPLDREDGVKFEALYAFENQERRAEVRNPETLRQFDRFTEGNFKFGGAYRFVNGRTPANDATRRLFRGSGWNENTGATVNRIYFGPKGLGSILGTSQPYYQLGVFGTPVDFGKQGNIDEAIQVFGDAGNGNFDDTLTNLVLSVRTYGQNPDRIDTQNTLGIAELGGYSSGAALNETPHLTTNTPAYPSTQTFADVWGGAIGGGVAPFSGMSLEKLAAPQTETGFAGPDGDFTWVLNNTNGGGLYECVAYLDAIASVDATVTTGTATLNGKTYNTWYEYTAQGRIRPVSGEGNTLGVFIENIPVGDRTLVEFRDDALQVCLYPVFTAVTVEIGQGAIDDLNAFFHVYEAATYNTAGAVTYQDASNTDVKGDANTGQPFISGTTVQWSHDFTTDGTVNVIIICEGDIAAQAAGVTQAKTAFTIADATVSQSCVPGPELNA